MHLSIFPRTTMTGFVDCSDALRVEPGGLIGWRGCEPLLPWVGKPIALTGAG